LTLGEEALEGRRRVLGQRHPGTWNTIFLVAMIYFEMNRIPEGIRLQEELRKLEDGEGKWSKELLSYLRQLNFAM